MIGPKTPRTLFPGSSFGRLALRLATVSASALRLFAVACSHSANDANFSERVCSTTLPHARQTLELLDEVVHTRALPGVEAWAALRGFSDRGTEIARRFHVATIGIPAEKDADRRAKRYVTASGQSAYERMVRETERVRNLPPRLTLVQSTQALGRLEQTIGEVYGVMTSAKELAVTQVPELQDAFANSDSCKELDRLETGLG